MSLTEPIPEQFSTYSRVEVLPAGTILAQQHSDVQHVHFFQSGWLIQTIATHNTKDTVRRVFRSDVLIGAASAVLGHSHTVTTALVGPSTIWSINADQFRQLNGTDLTVARWTSMILCLERSICHEFDGILRERTATAKVERYLAWMSARFSMGSCLQIPLTNVQTAELLNVEPEHYSLILRQLENARVIRRDRDILEILREEFFARYRNKMP